MKKLIIGTLFLAAAGFAGAANAADLPLKAPPPMVPVGNWTGATIGVGAGWMHDRVDGFWPNAAPLVQGFTYEQDRVAGELFMGGQMQFGQFVLGYETAGVIPIDSRLGNGSPNAGCPNPAFTCRAGIMNMYTVGAKVGWSPMPTNDWLIYAVGGWAGGEVRSRSFNAAGSTVDLLQQKSDNGWFAGVGVDYVVNRTPWADLIIGFQYRHVELGGQTFVSPVDLFSPLGANRRDLSSDNADIITGRVTVKFNHPMWEGVFGALGH
jgi:outer membrane immunogenic protein